MAFCITLLVLPNYKKKQSIKPDFILTTRATLSNINDNGDNNEKNKEIKNVDGNI